MIGEAIRRIAGRDPAEPSRASVQPVQAGSSALITSEPAPGSPEAIISELEARLKTARQALAFVRDHKRKYALAAARGDEYSIELIDRIEAKSANTRRTVEILELAIEDVQTRSADIMAAVQRTHDQYREQLPRLRLMERQRLENLVANITKWRHTEKGAPGQADAYEQQISDPRHSYITPPPDGFIESVTDKAAAAEWRKFVEAMDAKIVALRPRPTRPTAQELAV